MNYAKKEAIDTISVMLEDSTLRFRAREILYKTKYNLPDNMKLLALPEEDRDDIQRAKKKQVEVAQAEKGKIQVYGNPKYLGYWETRNDENQYRHLWKVESDDGHRLVVNDQAEIVSELPKRKHPKKKKKRMYLLLGRTELPDPEISLTSAISILSEEPIASRLTFDIVGMFKAKSDRDALKILHEYEKSHGDGTPYYSDYCIRRVGRVKVE